MVFSDCASTANVGAKTKNHATLRSHGEPGRDEQRRLTVSNGEYPVHHILNQYASGRGLNPSMSGKCEIVRDIDFNKTKSLTKEVPLAYQ